MNSKWTSLRDSIKPSSQFVEKMRADIAELSVEKEAHLMQKLATKIVIPEPKQRLKIHKKTKKNNSWSLATVLKSAFVRWGMLLGGTAFASIMIFPFIIPYFSSPTQANQETIIRNIEGTVALTRNGESVFLTDGGNILDNDVLITGENTFAEIIFFDGSILRLAPYTKVSFDELSPHPFLLSSGGISVSLEEGMIWMKTFTPSSEVSQVTVKTADLTVIPSKTAFLLQYKSGVDTLQVWENTATVIVKGVNVEDALLVRENESLQFSPFDKSLPNTSYLAEKTDFVNKNLEKDISYTKEFLEKITKKMKEKYVVDSLSDQIHTYLEKNSDPDSVEYLISEINNLLLVSHQTEEPSLLEELLPSESPVPPQYLPLRKQATSKKTYSSQNKENTSSPATVQTTEQQVYSVDVIEDDSKTAKELAEEYRKAEKEAYQNKVSQSFVEQVNQFSFESSRKTKAENLLKNLPENEESIQLLQKIESIVPDDLKDEVIEKKSTLEKKVLKNAPQPQEENKPSENTEEEIKN